MQESYMAGRDALRDGLMQGPLTPATFSPMPQEQPRPQKSQGDLSEIPRTPT
jgi:hypothetical protein